MHTSPRDTTMALRLNRGDAPGLTAARPLKDGTPRYRWIPGPSVRRRGFRPCYLLGQPGTLIAATPGGWAGLGFTSAPVAAGGAALALTVDGPPLALPAAIAACQALSAAVKAQAERAKAAPRPAARRRTTGDWFDIFLAACAQGRVLKEQREQHGPARGRLEPIGPHTLSTYRQGLTLVAPVLGADDPRDISRADLKAVFETIIETRGWHSAVRAQRSVSRCFNWLRQSDTAARAALPDPEVYTKMRLGKPTGRLRMASPAEAQAMFDALARPELLARQLGLHADDTPRAAPGAAAAWLFALWTCQRVNDVVGATDTQIGAKYFSLRQSKTGAVVSIPMLQPAREAIDLARATRAGLNRGEGLLFWDSQARRGGLPYRQVKGPESPTPGAVYFKRLNNHWTAARALAGQIHPSLIGEGRDAINEPVAALTLADSRDTGVTRLFEALGTDNQAHLAEIASWHGSSVKNLLELLGHYLVINPGFADKAGAAYERLAKANGFTV